MVAIKEHQENITDKTGLSLDCGMNDLIKMEFKLLAPVSVSKILLKKLVRPIWFYPYNVEVSCGQYGGERSKDYPPAYWPSTPVMCYLGGAMGVNYKCIGFNNAVTILLPLLIIGGLFPPR